MTSCRFNTGPEYKELLMLAGPFDLVRVVDQETLDSLTEDIYVR